MPCTKQSILNYLSTNIQEFQAKYGVERIGLFGSYARDEATDESDIDLYVHTSPLNKKVDLITAHNRMRPGLKSEVVYG